MILTKMILTKIDRHRLFLIIGAMLVPAAALPQEPVPPAPPTPPVPRALRDNLDDARERLDAFRFQIDGARLAAPAAVTTDKDAIPASRRAQRDAIRPQ